ncbi:transmembrane reductase CYB561D2-like [Coccinella septempunctata]|uniref:transmembrane reductase CYB561D2-like n=1 Tax=Coccinella septempunctata TaxID=41139 RepID=UPI001D05D98A|nr:transmembrane reductase CYB561D2-like [Coccinella septempunctata]
MARRKLGTDVNNVVQFFEFVFVLMIFLLFFRTEYMVLNVHVFHSTVAWLVSMTQGLLALHTVNPVVKKILGKDKVFNHWVIESVGLLGATLGFIAAYKDKIDKAEPHFFSWHAFLGIIGYALSLLSGLNGIPALYRKELKQYISPELNKNIHIITGTLGFIIGGFSLIVSLYSNWYTERTRSSPTSFILGVFLITSIMVWASIKPIGKVKNMLLKGFSKND